MNCNELKIWIKEHHELSRLPDTVQDHLQRCNDCRENINALMLSYQFIEMQKKVSLPDEKTQDILNQLQKLKKEDMAPARKIYLTLNRIAAIWVIALGILTGIVAGNIIQNKSIEENNPWLTEFSILSENTEYSLFD